MGELQATEPATDRATGPRPAARAKTPRAARRKWSARRTLIVIFLGSAGLWALIIALFLRS
jgi:hypothetical protein